MKKRVIALLLTMMMGLALCPNMASAGSETGTTAETLGKLGRSAALLTENTAVSKTSADLEISNLAELEAFRDSVNSGNSYKGKTIRLTADIDMSGSYGADIDGEEISWTPIGLNGETQMFQGNFNGGGHRITGLYINTDSEYQGLFGHIFRATISNVSVSGTIRANANPIGGIAGAISQSTVRNCHNMASISGPDTSIAGGIVGLSNSSTILNCSNAGSIGQGNSSCVGGIAGTIGGINSSTVIKNCYNTGTISGRFYVGGIAAMANSNTSELLNCYNAGPVSGTSFIGAIAGNNTTSTNEATISFTSCYYLENTAGGAVNNNDVEGTAKKTAAEFAVQSTFTGWNFDAVWEMDSASGRPVLQPPKEKNILLGDVNNDNAVDSKDALAILKYDVGIEQTDFIRETANVNKDEMVDSKDALAILKHDVGLETLSKESILIEIPAE